MSPSSPPPTAPVPEFPGLSYRNQHWDSCLKPRWNQPHSAGFKKKPLSLSYWITRVLFQRQILPVLLFASALLQSIEKSTETAPGSRNYLGKWEPEKGPEIQPESLFWYCDAGLACSLGGWSFSSLLSSKAEAAKYRVSKTGTKRHHKKMLQLRADKQKENTSDNRCARRGGDRSVITVEKNN